MLAMIFGFVQSVVSGLVGPVFTYLGKAKDDTLTGFVTASGMDEKAYEAYLAYQTSIAATQAASKAWWGPKLLIMIVGLPVCLHLALIFLDSTFQFGCGHHGCLQVAELPPAYVPYEAQFFGWLIGAAVVGPMASGVTAWLHRK